MSEMFKNYLASTNDIKIIEKALSFVIHPKMKFIFSNFSRISKTLVVSYDSNYIYIWQLNPIKLTLKVQHNLAILDKWQLGWQAGIVSREIEKFLPSGVKHATRFEIPIISGGLLTPFIKLQKNRNLDINPYTNEESYLATIIHELGHIYWNSFKLWWLSNKNENINLLESSRKLYINEIKTKEFDIKYPSPIYASEVFAHCTEYYASEIFWPTHKKNFDKYALSQINKMLEDENNKNLDLEDSVLEPTINQHNYSLVVGKLLISNHPKNWPKLLISSSLN